MSQCTLQCSLNYDKNQTSPMTLSGLVPKTANASKLKSTRRRAMTSQLDLIEILTKCRDVYWESSHFMQQKRFSLKSIVKKPENGLCLEHLKHPMYLLITLPWLLAGLMPLMGMLVIPARMTIFGATIANDQIIALRTIESCMVNCLIGMIIVEIGGSPEASKSHPKLEITRERALSMST